MKDSLASPITERGGVSRTAANLARFAADRINDKHSATSSPLPRKIEGDGRFTSPAFLVYDRDNQETTFLCSQKNAYTI